MVPNIAFEYFKNIWHDMVVSSAYRDQPQRIKLYCNNSSNMQSISI